MILSNPAPVAALLNIGISVISPESTPAQSSQLVDKGLKILRKRADMLWDYFSMKLSTDEDGELHLRSLPLLLDRFIPDLRQLPLFMLRLVQDVNWNEEASCFEGICRLTADFYARRTEDSRKSDVKKDSEEVDALFASDDELAALEDEKENTALPPTSECRRLKLPWQWTVEHVLIPAFRTVLLPAHSLCFCEGSAPSPALLKLTSLNDLYKVFERC
nr:unnamed protein product [Spirometra erinaceieuropaei]